MWRSTVSTHRHLQRPHDCDFIEHNLQPFAAFGLTFHSSSIMSSTSSSFRAQWCLLAGDSLLSACLLQARLFARFLYLGVLTTIQEMTILSHDKNKKLLRGLKAAEDAEDAAAAEKSAARMKTISAMRGAVVITVTGDPERDNDKLLPAGATATPTAANTRHSIDVQSVRRSLQRVPKEEPYEDLEENKSGTLTDWISLVCSTHRTLATRVTIIVWAPRLEPQPLLRWTRHMTI